MKGKPLWALGCMSGTSLDGVDAAMVLTDGVTVFEIGASAFRPYSDAERAILTAALGKWPGDDWVGEAAQVIDDAHAEVIAGFDGVDLVGFHGQTLAHAPGDRGTHQAGDGAALAARTGLPVVWDFRSADVALGGQGAPLAPFYHFAVAQSAGLDGPLAILNLGGVGNITWLDPRADRPEDPGALLAFDTGPANAPLNDLMAARRGLALDADGALAATGQVDQGVIDATLAHVFFARIPPKSLDRNDYPDLLDRVAHLSDADAAATLTALPAACVAAGLAHLPTRPAAIHVTGGGRRNPGLMAALAARTGLPVHPVEALGLDGDMLEAQAFAHLAVRVLNGLPTSAPGTTGVAGAVGGGQISWPDERAVPSSSPPKIP